MATKTQSDVKKAREALEKALRSEYEHTSSVMRTPDTERILLPEKMTYSRAIDVITMAEKRMRESVDTIWVFQTHPNDGLVNFARAIKERFGDLLSMETSGFWTGVQPGVSAAIPVSHFDTEVVPVDNCGIPGLPITFSLGAQGPDKYGPGYLKVTVESERMYQPLLAELENEIRTKLRDSSIFRGQAIDSRFGFMNLGSIQAERVVFSVAEQEAIDANIMSPIRHTQVWRDGQMSLKRGVLLSGSYGTGKTLLAGLVARAAVDNGWTFINVLPSDDFTVALRVARHYQPAVVFVEDVDADTSGPRDDRINDVLNTMDDILGKGGVEVLTIMTTNHPESIQPAMLRPGRLDSLIELGVLDRASMMRLIRLTAQDRYGKSVLTDRLDEERIYAAGHEYVPAYLVEAVVKARAYAVNRSIRLGEEPTVTSDDIVSAMQELRPQWKLMTGHVPMVADRLADVMTTMVEDATRRSLKEVHQALRINGGA